MLEICLFWREWWWELIIIFFEIVGLDWVEGGEFILFFLDDVLCSGNEEFVVKCDMWGFCVLNLRFCFWLIWCDVGFIGGDVMLDVVCRMFDRFSCFGLLFVLLVVEVFGLLVFGCM